MEQPGFAMAGSQNSGSKRSATTKFPRKSDSSVSLMCKTKGMLEPAFTLSHIESICFARFIHCSTPFSRILMSNNATSSKFVQIKGYFQDSSSFQLLTLDPMPCPQIVTATVDYTNVTIRSSSLCCAPAPRVPGLTRNPTVYPPWLSFFDQCWVQWAQYPACW